MWKIVRYRYGTWVCSEYYNDSWNKTDEAGLDGWLQELKRYSKKTDPPNQWQTREEGFKTELSNYRECNSNIVEPIVNAYFKSNSNYKYLRSDVKNKMLFYR